MNFFKQLAFAASIRRDVSTAFCFLLHSCVHSCGKPSLHAWLNLSFSKMSIAYQSVLIKVLLVLYFVYFETVLCTLIAHLDMVNTSY